MSRITKQSIADVVEVVGENATPATTTYYYSEAERAYLSEHELQTLSQYDFSELGYTLFEDNERIFKKLGWFDRILVQKSDLKFETISHLVVDMLKSFAEFTESNYNQRFSWPEDQQLINSIKQLTNTIESQTHFISPETMLRFLTYPPYLADHYYRFIVKHISEWYVDYDSDPWEKTDIVTKRFNKNFAAGKKSQIEQLIWMKDVPAFNTENPIWHMHPIVFLDGLKELEGPLITLEMVLAANLQQDVAQCTRVQPLLDKFAKKYGLTEPKEIAHFLSQVAHESKFKSVEEGLSYKPKNMRKTFGCTGKDNKYDEATDSCTLKNSREKLWSQEHFYARNPENLGNYVYANRMGNGDETSGEGYKYRGRGLIQITGKSEYLNITEAYKKNNDDKKDFVIEPDLLITDISIAVESAYLYWITKPALGSSLQQIAKTANVMTVSRIVNGGDKGYPDRLVRYNSLAPIMNLPLETE